MMKGASRRIEDLEALDVIPTSDEYPPTRWLLKCTLGDKYHGAFKVTTQEEADEYLLALVGHSLRYTRKEDEKGNKIPLTWREAFVIERVELAWSAYAKDVSHREFCKARRNEHGKRILIWRTEARDFVRGFFGAELPDNILGNPKKDILERVHIRREKEAKKRGVVYQRNVKPIQIPTEEPPDNQGRLF